MRPRCYDEDKYEKKDRCYPERECKEKNPCEPTKSQLFCISNVGATRFEGENDEMVIWQDLAELKVCGEKCSQVLQTVSGVIHVEFEDSEGTSAVALFQFRIIDEFGHEICTKTLGYAAEVAGDTEVFFPFSFQCCDELRGCEPWQRFRLQADLLDERLANNNDVWIQDITWTAIVFENNRDRY